MEQSSPPWRVFDAPAGDAGAVTGPDGPSGRSSQAGTIEGISANARLAVLAIVGAIAIAVVAVLVAVSGAGGSVIEGPAASSDVAAAGATSPVGGGHEVVVDVSGAVAMPGLYHLAAGSRVGDAIDAAGGFSRRVDVARVGSELNLAAAVSDGAQIHVPSRDDPAAGGGGIPGASPNGAGGGGGGRLINLNTATEAELDSLSGIGPVTAGKIIESRSTAPFTTVDELRERGLVGQKTFDRIRAQLTVG